MQISITCISINLIAFKFHYYKALTIIKKYHYVTNNGMNSKLLRIDRK